MSFERLQGLFVLRHGISNEGEVFPPNVRPEAAKMLKNSMSGLLPIDSSQGIQAIATLLQHERRQKLFSRPIACVSFLDEHVLEELIDKTEQKFDNRIYHTFVAFHDGMFGFSQALARITIAEDFRLNPDGQAFDAILHTFPEESVPPIDEQVDLFLLTQQEGQHCAGLLTKDPTGIKLLEDFVERLKNPDSSYVKALIEFSEVPEFVIAGAEVALDYYRAIYSLSV